MAHMKAWHLVVMNGWKVVKDIIKYDVKEARELEKTMKAEYAELNAKAKAEDPKSPINYVVSREWY